MDFVRLYGLHKRGWFVVRCKEPVSFQVLQRRAVDKSAGFKCDQTVRLKSSWSKRSFLNRCEKSDSSMRKIKSGWCS